MPYRSSFFVCLLSSCFGSTTRQLPILRLALTICKFAMVSCESESRSVVSDSLQPHGLYRPWNSPGQNTVVGSCALLQGNLPKPGIKPRSPILQADSLLAEPQGKLGVMWHSQKFWKTSKILNVLLFVYIFVYSFSNVLYKGNWINYHCVCCQF